MRLARGQERTLRNWLYKPTGSPTERFAAALEQAAAEVEDTYGITVETVVVGDAATSTTGSARWSRRPGRRWSTPPATPRCSTVSLYAEVEPEQVSVFVRDRGAGFDPYHRGRSTGTASAGRSSAGCSGTAAGPRSAPTPGEGTEVRLTMPSPAQVHDGRDSA